MSVPSRTGKEFLEFDINREWRQGFFGAVSPLSSLNYLPGTRKGLSLSHGKTELLLIIVSIPSLIQQIRWDILQMSRVKTSVYHSYPKPIKALQPIPQSNQYQKKKNELDQYNEARESLEWLVPQPFVSHELDEDEPSSTTRIKNKQEDDKVTCWCRRQCEQLNERTETLRQQTRAMLRPEKGTNGLRWWGRIGQMVGRQPSAKNIGSTSKVNSRD
ncbi:hypothetical protein RUM44_011049 [Polyplax serrata]|uniref:Uncharacterized protein n=1 Tax=Polyplax serrata TaxID=468196 RepID=A0ABR1ANX1_POLSC